MFHHFGLANNTEPRLRRSDVVYWKRSERYLVQRSMFPVWSEWERAYIAPVQDHVVFFTYVEKLKLQDRWKSLDLCVVVFHKLIHREIICILKLSLSEKTIKMAGRRQSSGRGSIGRVGVRAGRGRGNGNSQRNAGNERIVECPESKLFQGIFTNNPVWGSIRKFFFTGSHNIIFAEIPALAGFLRDKNHALARSFMSGEGGVTVQHFIPFVINWIFSEKGNQDGFLRLRENLQKRESRLQWIT